MKKITQSIVCAIILTGMLFSVVVPMCFGLTKDDYRYDPVIPDQNYVGETVSSYVRGDYNAGYDFYWCRFTSTRGLGGADGYNGYLWFWWTVDAITNEYYTAGSQQDESDNCDASYLRCSSLSGFYILNGDDPPTLWYRSATTLPVYT